MQCASSPSPISLPGMPPGSSKGGKQPSKCVAFLAAQVLALHESIEQLCLYKELRTPVVRARPIFLVGSVEARKSHASVMQAPKRANAGAVPSCRAAATPPLGPPGLSHVLHVLRL